MGGGWLRHAAEEVEDVEGEGEGDAGDEGEADGEVLFFVEFLILLRMVFYLARLKIDFLQNGNFIGIFQLHFC